MNTPTQVKLDGTVESFDGVLEPLPHLVVMLRTKDGPTGLHTVKIFGRAGSYWQGMLQDGQRLTVTGAAERGYVRAALIK